MSEDIKFRKTENNQTIAIKDGEVVGGAGICVGPDNLPTFSSYEGEFSSFTKKAKSYAKNKLAPVIESLRFPKGMPKDCEKILMPKASINELASKLNNDKVLALPFIPQVYRTGKFREASDTKHPDIEAIVYTSATIKVDANTELLIQVQTKRRRGNKEYFHYGIAKADPVNEKKEKTNANEPFPKPNRRNVRHSSDKDILTQDSTPGESAYEFFDFEVKEMKKNTTFALDRASVREIDNNGFLHVAVSPLTMVQVAPYYGFEIPRSRELGLEPSKTYYGYRPAEELSSPETVKSVNGIPIQLGHHNEFPDSPKNRSRVGMTGTDGAFEAPYLVNSLHIVDRVAQDAIKSGEARELSLSYDYEPDFTAGETESGERYDFVMRNIMANHVALVDKGRAGPTVLVNDSSIEEKPNMEEMEKSTVEEKLVAEVAPALQDALDEIRAVKEESTADEAEEAVKTSEAPEAEAEKAEDDGGLDDEKVKKALEESGFLQKPEPLQRAFVEGLKFALAKPAEQSRAQESGQSQAVNDEADCGAAGEEAVDEAPTEIEAVDPEREEPAEDEAEEDGKDARETLAQDAAQQAREAVIAEYSAIDECRPVLGNVRLGAYDSAYGVYRAALKQLGVSVPESADSRSCYLCYMAGQKRQADRKLAMDGMPAEPEGLRAFLGNVKD